MNFEPWMLTAGANFVMVVVYALVSISMIRAIIDGRQLRSNPLLTATAAIFVTCTLGHGSHLAHALIGTAGVWGGTELSPAAAVRAEFGDMRLLVWDVTTAIVAVYFYTLRSRFAVVYKGAALCEDMEKRERQAMEMHDNIVQGLAHAKMALDLGERAEGYKAIDDTLAASRRIMTEVLGREGSGIELGPGDIRRRSPGGAA
jgi:signal transduction histidine kinase